MTENIIFISYRREDSKDIVGRIYDRLVDTFGEETIFRDIGKIPIGVNYKDYLITQISQCQVLLVVIGKMWAKVVDEDGELRIEDPTDLVRLEVMTAISRKIPVIPLFVQGASMPKPRDLPSELENFSYYNGLPIRSDPDFDNDIKNLRIAISEIFVAHSNLHIWTRGIKQFGKMKALEHLIEVFNCNNNDKRYQAAMALKIIGEEALPIVINSLQSPHSKIRASSAYLLGEFEAKAELALPNLRKLANDPDQEASSYAKEAIKKIGDKSFEKSIEKGIEKGIEEIANFFFKKIK